MPRRDKPTYPAMVGATKDVGIRDVVVEDWDYLTQLAADLSLNMPQLIHILADELRGRTVHRPELVEFINEQRRHRMEFVRDALFRKDSG